MNKFRILKVYKKFRRLRWGKNTTVPEIRLEGRWLEKLGFKQGNEILIEQKKHKLIITIKKEKEHNKVYKK